MSTVAEFTMDQEFFEEFYHGWIWHVRPWQRLVLPAAMAGFGVGLGILVLVPGFRLTGCVVSVISLIETMRTVTRRARWMRRMKDGPGYGCTVLIEFDETAVRIKTSTSDSRMEWHCFRKWFDTPEGLYLQPQTGMTIYVPYRALTPQKGKAAIVDRLILTQKSPV